ncbi:beta-propeller domain-containing protein [Candidatus Bathyarchaeota archaeon]|nr:beta-propeller domain-containing protein [Candidatus Bathyarchaeota archaeon]
MNIRSAVSYALTLILLGSLWGVAIFNWRSIHLLNEPPMDPSPLKRFSSEDELRAFLNRSSPGSTIFYGPLGWQIPRGPVSPTQALSAKMAAIPEALDYSGTNIQVEGVDEADLVKTDGRYIYISANGSIVIVRAHPPENAEVLSSIPLNRSVGEIFLNGDKLAVFLPEGPPKHVFTSRRLMAPQFEAQTIVKIFDITDRAHPVEERSIEVDGHYLSSRMIGEYIYLVTIQPAYLKGGEPVTPKIRTRELAVTIPVSSIYYANYTDSSYAYTNIFSMSILEPGRPLNHESFLVGASSCIYVSTGHIYITVPRYDQQGAGRVEKTSIYKIRIDDGKIIYLAGGEVPGWVLNQFSMDEFDGYFRIATTMGRPWGEAVRLRNNVYILNSSLGITGRLEGLAPGEEVYSARFIGSRCYLVTFKKVDPLFVLDLSSPTNPKVLGKLKIPGYSNYLHPYDEGHLIGIGKETVEAEGGELAWYQGVKISLFDVSDVENPKELAKYTVGDRGTDTPVLRDHKALLFIGSRSMLVLPILEARINPGAYPGGVPPNAQGNYVYQGAYIFRISLEGGIELLGRITHMDGVDDLARSGLYFESPYAVKRALHIEDTIYTISDRMIKMNSLETLKEVKRVILP